MQFAAQYMAETLHRHETTAATQWLEQRRRVEEAGAPEEDAGPVRRHHAWVPLFQHRNTTAARLAHR